MANLRKRVAACDLTRDRPMDDPNANDTEQEQLDNRPLLPKVCQENYFFVSFRFFFCRYIYLPHKREYTFISIHHYYRIVGIL